MATTKPQSVSEIAATAEIAFKKVLRDLLFPEKHEAYAMFKQANVKLDDGSYMVSVAYALKPGFQETAALPGTGAYRTDMERKFGNVRL